MQDVGRPQATGACGNGNFALEPGSYRAAECQDLWCDRSRGTRAYLRRTKRTV